MDENGLKYTSRTTLHFDIGLGWNISKKKFHDEKNNFFGPAYMLTGRNWRTSQATPGKGPKGPKTVAMGILHDYMSF